MTNIENLKKSIIAILDEKKANDIVEFDLSKCNSRLAEVSIIASGTSSRHTQSVAEYVYRFLKGNKLHPIMEGKAETGWVMIESNGIEIHLFKPDLREYYNLEEILSSGKTPASIS